MLAINSSKSPFCLANSMEKEVIFISWGTISSTFLNIWESVITYALCG